MAREIFENYYDLLIKEKTELRQQNPFPSKFEWIEINETMLRCINPENRKLTPREIYNNTRISLKFPTQPVNDVMWEVVQRSMMKYAKRMVKIFKNEGFLFGDGINYDIGQKVLFLGRSDYEMGKEIASYRPLLTVISAINYGLEKNYIIEHPDGKPKDAFVGFEGVSEELLSDDKKYLHVVPDSLILNID